MKKIISLLLSMMLLFSCTAAFAQESTVVDISGRFQIKGVLPDGYQLSILSQDSLSLEGEIKSADPDAPVMHLYVAYDETKNGIGTLNDLPGSELENIRQSFLEEYDFSGKQIIPFCSHGGGRFGQSLTAIAKLAPEANMGEGLSVHYSGGSSLPDNVTAWLEKNNIEHR